MSLIGVRKIPILSGSGQGRIIGVDYLESLGPRALWLITDAEESPYQYIPNRMASTLDVSNALRAPRAAFGGPIWTRTSCTISDAVATALDGSQSASTLAGTGLWSLKTSRSVTFPAGTYTVAVNAKRDDVTDQEFTFTHDAGSTLSSVKIATDTIQRFSYTFVAASPFNVNTVQLRSISGGGACNIEICDFELFYGSSDLGPSTVDDHLLLGLTNEDTPYSVVDGEMDRPKGVIVLSSPLEDSLPFTLQACIDVTSALSYQTIFCDLRTWVNFKWGVSSGPRPAWTSGNFQNGPGDTWQYGNFWAPHGTGNGKFVLTHRYDGTYYDLFLNDIHLLRDDRAISFSDLYTVEFNLTNLTYNSYCNYSGAIALFDRALDDSEVRQSVVAQEEILSENALVLSVPRIYVSDGDSITVPTYGYMWKYGDYDTDPQWYGAAFAQSGNGLSNLVARGSNVDRVIPPSISGRDFVFSVLIGANDLGTYGTGSAGYITDLRAYCAARAAAGFQIVLCTILPIDGDATHNSRRAVVNADIVANPEEYGNCLVCDFAADAQMGVDNSRTLYPSLWNDTKHPSAAGHDVLETILRPVMNGI